MNTKTRNSSLVKWTLLIIFLPLAAFLGVHRWEKYHKQLPMLYTIRGWTYDMTGTKTGSGDTSTRRTGDFSDPCHALLSDQNERTVYLPQFSGKVVVAHFFFTRCPASCPKMMQHMQRLQQAFGKNPKPELLSLTVDPEYDTPPVLFRYARKYEADSASWLLLTGDKKQLYRIARTDLHVTASDGDGGPEDFIHSDQMVLIDPAGNIRGYYNGTLDNEVDQLINDIKILQHAF